MRGYVFPTEIEEIFGILTYEGKPTVRMRIVLDANTVSDACRALNLKFVGEFVPADTDQAAWGRTIFEAKGYAEVLTDN